MVGYRHGAAGLRPPSAPISGAANAPVYRRVVSIPLCTRISCLLLVVFFSACSPPNPKDVLEPTVSIRFNIPSDSIVVSDTAPLVGLGWFHPDHGFSVTTLVIPTEKRPANRAILCSQIVAEGCPRSEDENTYRATIVIGRTLIGFLSGNLLVGAHQLQPYLAYADPLRAKSGRIAIPPDAFGSKTGSRFHPEDIAILATSADQRIVVLGTKRDTCLRVYTVQHGRDGYALSHTDTKCMIAPGSTIRGGLLAAALSPDGSRLAASLHSTVGGQIVITSLGSRTPERSIIRPPGSVRKLRFYDQDLITWSTHAIPVYSQPFPSRSTTASLVQRYSISDGTKAKLESETLIDTGSSELTIYLEGCGAFAGVNRGGLLFYEEGSGRKLGFSTISPKPRGPIAWARGQRALVYQAGKTIAAARVRADACPATQPRGRN